MPSVFYSKGTMILLRCSQPRTPKSIIKALNQDSLAISNGFPQSFTATCHSPLTVSALSAYMMRFAALIFGGVT